MNIVSIYGTERKGSTYNIVQLFLKRMMSSGDHLTEFFLPEDMPHFCVGCVNCITKGEQFCPHAAAVHPIQEAMLRADLLVLSSPVYVLRASSQMKALLDHLAFLFMMHRPPEAMFSKTALVVSTAAGGGMKSAIKDIKASLAMWGVGSIFSYGKAVYASNWAGVSEKHKAQIQKSVDRDSEKILASIARARPRLKAKLLFHVFRQMHKRVAFSALDKQYWRSNGWLDQNRPW